MIRGASTPGTERAVRTVKNDQQGGQQEQVEQQGRYQSNGGQEAEVSCRHEVGCHQDHELRTQYKGRDHHRPPGAPIGTHQRPQGRDAALQACMKAMVDMDGIVDRDTDGHTGDHGGRHVQPDPGRTHDDEYQQDRRKVGDHAQDGGTERAQQKQHEHEDQDHRAPQAVDLPLDQQVFHVREQPAHAGDFPAEIVVDVLV